MGIFHELKSSIAKAGTLLGWPISELRDFGATVLAHGLEHLERAGSSSPAALFVRKTAHVGLRAIEVARFSAPDDWEDWSVYLIDWNDDDRIFYRRLVADEKTDDEKAVCALHLAGFEPNLISRATSLPGPEVRRICGRILTQTREYQRAKHDLKAKGTMIR
ncbi:hypothetical protein [Cryptosporangium sp. NPDC051539]|uniref:hypothetical protein n=1 Tax=Cryptosporangium sp. NPDC051539 TaxID=3363962 RepID=UPI003788927C